jgi:hypothetical protein
MLRLCVRPGNGFSDDFQMIETPAKLVIGCSGGL